MTRTVLTFTSHCEDENDELKDGSSTPRGKVQSSVPVSGFDGVRPSLPFPSSGSAPLPPHKSGWGFVSLGSASDYGAASVYAPNLPSRPTWATANGKNSKPNSGPVKSSSLNLKDSASSQQDLESRLKLTEDLARRKASEDPGARKHGDFRRG